MPHDTTHNIHDARYTQYMTQYMAGNTQCMAYDKYKLKLTTHDMWHKMTHDTWHDTWHMITEKLVLQTVNEPHEWYALYMTHASRHDTWYIIHTIHDMMYSTTVQYTYMYLTTCVWYTRYIISYTWHIEKRRWCHMTYTVHGHDICHTRYMTWH